VRVEDAVGNDVPVHDDVIVVVGVSDGEILLLDVIERVMLPDAVVLGEAVHDGVDGGDTILLLGTGVVLTVAVIVAVDD